MNIFNLFSDGRTSKVFAQVETPKVATVTQVRMKSDAQVVEQIHNEFDTAADRALQEAHQILDGTKDISKEKGELMAKLGFTGAKEAIKIANIKKTETISAEKAEKVNKYKEKYPQYKFIFWEQVSEICNRYGLVCGTADKYKGDIPYKNLQEIENFKVRDEDKYAARIYRELWQAADSSDRSNWEVRTPKGGDFNHRFYMIDLPFYICAPRKDMNTEGMVEKNGILQREYPDPIVLHPMKDGCLIVSKWGIEGEDQMFKQ